MTLLEAGLPGDRFRVDAVDVSARSLARAIAGVYGPNSFRGAGSRFRSAYFREQNGSFTVDPTVRSTVRFHLGNLLDPALLADRSPFDAVFCRNLLIYLDDDAQGRAFATLGRLIVEGGLLFLGHADRLDDPKGTPFEPAGGKGSFAYRKRGARPKQAKPIPKTLPSKPPASPLPPGEGPGVRVVAPPPASGTGSFRHRQAGQAPQPGPLPGGEGGRKEGKRPDQSTDSLLDRASGLADLGRHDEAKGLVDRAIANGESGAMAYFLLGLIAQAAGTRDRAEAHYLKAIYLDPQHDEALLALALLAGRKGDLAAEAAYRRRAGRVLARKVIP